MNHSGHVDPKRVLLSSFHRSSCVCTSVCRSDRRNSHQRQPVRRSPQQPAVRPYFSGNEQVQQGGYVCVRWGVLYGFVEQSASIIEAKGVSLGWHLFLWTIYLCLLTFMKLYRPLLLKVRPTEALTSHHYQCLCTKEIWILLMHFLGHRNKTLHTQVHQDTHTRYMGHTCIILACWYPGLHWHVIIDNSDVLEISAEVFVVFRGFFLFYRACSTFWKSC